MYPDPPSEFIRRLVQAQLSGQLQPPHLDLMHQIADRARTLGQNRMVDGGFGSRRGPMPQMNMAQFLPPAHGGFRDFLNNERNLGGSTPLPDFASAGLPSQGTLHGRTIAPTPNPHWRDVVFNPPDFSHLPQEDQPSPAPIPAGHFVEPSPLERMRAELIHATKSNQHSHQKALVKRFVKNRARIGGAQRYE